MAKFSMAFEKTMGHEGGYVNDKMDFGGETYRGISRRFHPNWEGWETIDNVKQLCQTHEMNEYLGEDGALHVLVLQFYKERFWDVFWGDEHSSQSIANELFDTGVNMDPHRAIKFLQQALNFLNRNGKLFDDLDDDGLYGRNTHMALAKIFTESEKVFLLKIVNVLQGMHYLALMRKHPEQEKYARGWFNRVSI